MKVDQGKVADGFEQLSGGMDSGKHPSMLGRMRRDQAWMLTNCTVRGGFVMSRPGFKNITLSFANEDAELFFTQGNLQGAAYYNGDRDTYLLAMVAGRLFRVDPNDGQVLEVSLAAANSALRARAYFKQVEQFMVIQDGDSRAIIYDGASARRAADNEVPVGTVMAYGNGRLWVAVFGRYFVAGDIVGGPSGTAAYNYSDAALKFTENTYLNEGGYFRAPSEITAMQFVANPDTSLGQGELLVFTRDQALSINVPTDRAQWKNVTFPIQTVSLIANGAMGDRSTVIVNGDVWFRSRDGIRSFRMARREITSWGNIPMSTEVHQLLKYDTEFLLSYSQAVLFDNRLLMTVSPRFTPGMTYHGGLIALDFHTISSMGSRSDPAYDGLWTGVQPTAMVTGRFLTGERCLIFSRNADGENELWELTKEDRFDNLTTRIASVLESPAYGFKLSEARSSALVPAQVSNSAQLKRLGHAEIWVDDMSGTVDFNFKFKPDDYPAWLDWTSFSLCNTYCAQSCPPKLYRPTYKARQTVCEPPESCEVVQGKSARVGYEFQVRLAWTGHARIKALKLTAEDMQETLYGDQPDSSCQAIEYCGENRFTYTA